MSVSRFPSDNSRPLREVKTTFVDERELLDAYLSLSLSLDELLTKIFFAYNRYLFFYLRRRGWSDPASEDLLQAAWVTLWRDVKSGKFFERPSFADTPAARPMLTFLIKSCEFLGANLYRRESHFPLVSLDDAEGGASPAANCRMEEEIQLKEVRQLVGRVCTTDEQRVLHLLTLGLDRAEIADITGEKPHWVDNRRRSALEKIRSALGTTDDRAEKKQL